MRTLLKLTQIATSMKLSPTLWQEKIYQAWELGQQKGEGFAIGEDNDLPNIALTKEGYELITEINGMVIGTDWLNKIVVVTSFYGPWAVDITDNLLSSNYSASQKFSLFNAVS